MFVTCFVQSNLNYAMCGIAVYRSCRSRDTEDVDLVSCHSNSTIVHLFVALALVNDLGVRYQTIVI